MPDRLTLEDEATIRRLYAGRSRTLDLLFAELDATRASLLQFVSDQTADEERFAAILGVQMGEEVGLCVLVERVEQVVAERDRLRTAIAEHHAQKADDRCIEDDDRLYAAAGLPPCDRRVGDQAAMLENCKRFIERRCEGGGWPSYAELEAERDRLARFKSLVHAMLSMAGVSEHAELQCRVGSRLTELIAERNRLRSGCNPTCPGCGLRPCNEHGGAVLWCDECASLLIAERDQLRELLRPFRKWVVARDARRKMVCGDVLSDWTVVADDFGSGPLTIAAFRRVAEALAAKKVT